MSLSKRGGAYGYGYGYGYGVDEAPDDDDGATLSRFDRVRGRTMPSNGNGTPKPERPMPALEEVFPDAVPVEPASTPEAGSRRDS